MWQLNSHMVGPAAVILGFTVTTLWYFKASAPIEMKFSVWSKKKREEILWTRWWHRQWRMWIQCCLSRPLRSMWLFFNAFTQPFSSSSPFTVCEQRDSWSLATPHPPSLPCLITSSSTQTHADSSALFPPPRLSLMFLPPPLQRVP